MTDSERPCWSCGSPCARVGFTKSYDKKRILGVVFECPKCRYEFTDPFDGTTKIGKRRFSLPFRSCR